MFAVLASNFGFGAYGKRSEYLQRMTVNNHHAQIGYWTKEMEHKAPSIIGEMLYCALTVSECALD